ncbi:DNA polymerase IV [Lentisalinibacter salinarum]|uniref:DNA polymerase IV n=1 Tax=Lentisalinibacter salinarum TaxID=2992239 RepID=UPI003864FD6C
MNEYEYGERQRWILHVDMDAFYASVEQRDRPELRGLPVIVGGSSARGVVAAASYEARRYGIRSAMPTREALRRCPEAICVKGRMEHYQAVSRQIFGIFRRYTPVVEGLSLDEAFLDVTGSLNLFGSAMEIARAVKDDIRAETELCASVGIAPNKLVAKIASDLDKPDGLVLVTPGNLRETLDPLPVETLPGIGRQTLARLHALGVRSIADLRTAAAETLRPVFGRYTGRAQERAAGIDDRPVVVHRPEKSISAEQTFDQDLESIEEQERRLLRLAERTGARLRAKRLVAGTVQVKIRAADFTTYTRQTRLHPPGNATRSLFETARELLAAWRDEYPGRNIRLLGVGGAELTAAEQLDLFDTASDGGGSGLDQTVDRIRERFGSAALSRARSMDRE